MKLPMNNIGINNSIEPKKCKRLKTTETSKEVIIIPSFDQMPFSSPETERIYGSYVRKFLKVLFINKKKEITLKGVQGIKFKQI